MFSSVEMESSSPHDSLKEKQSEDTIMVPAKVMRFAFSVLLGQDNNHPAALTVKSFVLSSLIGQGVSRLPHIASFVW